MGTLKLNKKSDITRATEAGIVENEIDISHVEIKSYDETVVNEAKACELAKVDAGFVEEIKELRSETETVYKRNDGTYRKVITSVPTRYRDENGKLKDIKNTLIDNGKEIFNSDSFFKIKFNKEANNSIIFDLQKGKNTMSLAADRTSKSHGHNSGCVCKLCADKDNAVAVTLYDGTEIEYLTLNDRIKENIIIKERQDSYEYYFSLKIGELIVEEGKHNDLLLKDEKTGKTEFIIPAPYMYDANNKKSNKVSYEIDVNGNELIVKVIADSEFINSKDRAFPVIIDPQIVVPASYVHCYTIEYEQGEDWLEYPPMENYLELYNASSYEWQIAYVEFSKPTAETIKQELIKSYPEIAISEVIIKKVQMVLHCTEGYGIISIDGVRYDLNLYSDEINGGGKDFYVDVTNSEAGNSGKISMRVPRDERGSAYFDTNPGFLVDYVIESPSQDELEDYNKPFIKQMDLSDKANGYLYLKDGSLVTAFNSVVASSFALPINITHINKAGSGESVYGKDWHLNLNKKLRKAESDTASNSVYLFTDELGDNYLFSEKYYYISDNGNKVFISNKKSIKVDIEGNLTYNGHTVYKHYDCNGYTIVPHIDDFIDSQYIQQYQDEYTQLEEYLVQIIPTLDNVVYLLDGEIRHFSRASGDTELDYLKNAYETIQLYRNDDTIRFVTLSEAIQYKTLNLNMEQIDVQISINKNNKANLEKERDKISDVNSEEYKAFVAQLEDCNNMISIYNAQKGLISQQLASIVNKAKADSESILSTFRNAISKYEQFELLKLQTPVNFLISDEGIINGFNENGDLVFIGDTYNNYASLKYNADNQVSCVYDDSGETIRFEYNNNLLQSITDNRGRTVKYSYDKNGKLSMVEFADGSTLIIGYSSEKIQTIDTSNYLQARITYSSNKVVRIINKAVSPRKGDISTLNVSYTSNGITLEESGNTEEYAFYVKGRIQQYKKYSNANIGSTTIYTYVKSDENKIVKANTVYSDGEIEEMTEEYNILDKLIRQEGDWKNISSTVQQKEALQYEYDNSGKPIKEMVTRFIKIGDSVNEEKLITKYSYNAAGSLILTESFVEGEEFTTGVTYTENVFNEKGSLLKTIKWNSLDSSSKFYSESVYNENGQVIFTNDAIGEKSAEYEYVNNTNIVNSIKFNNGSKFAYGRNPNNFEVSSVSQSTEEGEENKTDIIYQYGMPAKITSGNTVLEYEYDVKGRNTGIKLNDVDQISSTFKDYVQNTSTSADFYTQTNKIRANNKEVKFVYAKSGSCTSEGSAMTVTETLTVGSKTLFAMTYDTTGKLKKVEIDDASKVINYTYDAYKNLTEVEEIAGTETLTKESYIYNEYGLLTGKTFTVGATVHTYGYSYKDNAAHTLENISYGAYNFKPFVDLYKRYTGKEIYNGSSKIASERVTYRKVGDHATNMPATIWFGNSLGVKDSIKYKYDICGNICEIKENGHLIAKYQYDSLNRLIREDNKALGITSIYSYDQNGNITERCEYAYTSKSGEELSELNCKHFSYDYNGDRLINYNGETFAYNEIGNPTIYRGKSVEWLNGKSLTKFGSTTFSYDGLGRRTSKDNITFTYDSDGRIIKQSNGLEFIYDNSGVVGVTYNGSDYFYRKDAQGNIIALLDRNGNAVVYYEYDAWGNHAIIDSDGENVESGIGALNPFRYRGYYFDTETQLYYLQTRYYDPEIGRFISQDKIDYAEPETINGLNLYAYCGNNPVMNIDPTGEFLISLLIAIAAGAVIGGLIGGVTAVSKGDNFWSGFLAGALVGGVLGGAMMLGGAAMLAVAGKAVAGIGVLATFGAKASFLIGTAAVTYIASVGAGIGAYAIQESMNDREINKSEMWRQGLNTGLKGLLSFGTGMVLAAAGAYPNLLATGKMTFVQTIQRSFNLFLHYGIPRAIASLIIQTPWKILIQ